MRNWPQYVDAWKQNNTTWTKHLVEKFTKPGNLVQEASAGTFSVAKACMIILKHRKFIGCAVDPSCVAKPIPQLIMLNARQLLREEWVIDGDE